MFKDGFLYKTVSTKSISAQNIKPTFDELENGDFVYSMIGKKFNAVVEEIIIDFLKGNGLSLSEVIKE